jgi:hypothetical protein
MIEAEQVKLNKQIDQARADCKKKLKELVELSPSLTEEMDPYVIKLLVKEQ